MPTTIVIAPPISVKKPLSTKFDAQHRAITPVSMSVTHAIHLVNITIVFFISVWFYCDEETFKRVLAFRKFTNKYSKETSSSKTESAKSMMIMADIYLSMRKSLGYEDKLDRDSFLYLIINDWEEMKFKPEYKEAYEYKFDEYY